MAQLQLPVFPEGSTPINHQLAFVRQDNTITYIYGALPVFSHDVDDMKTFRMFTSQLYVNGRATQAEICRAFGVSKISVKRFLITYLPTHLPDEDLLFQPKPFFFTVFRLFNWWVTFFD